MEGNVLFNDVLNTFYLWLYGTAHIIRVTQLVKRKPATITPWTNFLISRKASVTGIILWNIPQPLVYQLWSTGWNKKRRFQWFTKWDWSDNPLHHEQVLYHWATSCNLVLCWRKEGNVLFNDALNTFYLWLHRLLFPISSKGSFICIDKIPYNMAFVTPVMEYWLGQETAQWVHHEGSVWWPIAPWPNALTTELHLAPGIVLNAKQIQAIWLNDGVTKSGQVLDLSLFNLLWLLHSLDWPHGCIYFAK